MIFNSLSDFLKVLEEKNQIKYINHPVSTDLEITEISQRFLKNNGPALFFNNVIKQDGTKSSIPVITNLYASIDRISLALGLNNKDELIKLGELLSYLRNPTPPQSIKEGFEMLPLFKRIISMNPKKVSKAQSQEIIIKDNIDLNILPIQKCWPLDASPLITWGIVVTKDVNSNKIKDYNLGIYRMQVLDKDKLIMRWLKMRGGAMHFNNWQEKGQNKFPAAVVLGTEPSIAMSAVVPVPENVSEYNFAGLLKTKKIELVSCVSIDLEVPANAEIIIEGEISYEDYAEEGPFGDHTGYYNEVEKFPIFYVKAITMKNSPVYLSTYTGKPPDEPSILALALNEVFIPIIQKQFPEIIDFFLPEEGCSYRIAIASIRKTYPGQAKRVMMGIWSYLKQFMYTKFIIIVDDDINIRDWKEVMWAISTRSDPSRDTCFIDNSPIDYLDFASPKLNLGSKMGIDATNKIYPETLRTWGQKIDMRKDIIQKIDEIWNKL